MTSETRPFGQQLAGLAGAAFRSFIGTFAVVLLAGIVLAGISFGYVNRFSTGYALLAGGLAIIEAAAAGIFLAGQRAVLSAAARGLETFHLGGTIVRMIFDRIGGATEQAGTGPTTNRVADGLERLPLAQAEQLLHRALQSVLGDPSAGGGLRRRIHGRLVNQIGKYTLARFREQNAEQGGIELPKLREELVQTVDAALARKILAARLMPTLVVVIGLPLLAAAQTSLIRSHAAGIPSQALRIMENADRFELISLDPMETDNNLVGEGFHGFRVLGSAEIQGTAIRRLLIDGLQKEIDYESKLAACFWPRHGIRATSGDQTAELVICFECSRIHVYINGELKNGVSILPTSQPMFDDTLRLAGVPLPKPAKVFDPFGPKSPAH